MGGIPGDTVDGSRRETAFTKTEGLWSPKAQVLHLRRLLSEMFEFVARECPREQIFEICAESVQMISECNTLL